MRFRTGKFRSTGVPPVMSVLRHVCRVGLRAGQAFPKAQFTVQSGGTGFQPVVSVLRHILLAPKTPYPQQLRQTALYLWSAPTSALGLAFLPFLRLTGGHYQIVDGVLELHGGLVRTFLRDYTLLPHGALAMTIGHVVLGLDRDTLQRSRAHERIHVRQCERWGPFFIPAYLLASAWIAVNPRGRDPYRDNPFEREAYDLAP